MAELLKQELNVEAKLIEGDRGEFTIWMGDELIAKRGWWSFPNEKTVVEAVRARMKE